MNKPKEKSVGRPSILESEKLTEKYIKIWCAHFFKKLPIWELTKEFDCSKNTIKNAITFVNKQFVNIPSKELLSGAIFSIRERIKRMTVLLEKEGEKDEPSIRNLKEMNSEIRSDEIELNKLQSLYEEKYSVEIEVGGSIKQILEALAGKK